MTPKFQQLQGTFCGHVDERHRRQLRDDCKICSGLRFRCIICLQSMYEMISVLGKCESAPRVPGVRAGTTKKGEHVFAVDGPGALCVLCGEGRKDVPLKQDGERVPTDCLWGREEHGEFRPYPFVCEVCTMSVSRERPTWCDESFGGKHLIASGFVDLGVLKRVAVRVVDQGVTDRIAEHIKALQGDWKHRRFVTRRRTR